MNRGALAAPLAVIACGVVAFGAWLMLRAPHPVISAGHFVAPQTRRVSASVLATGVIRLRSGAEVRVGSQVSGIVQKLNVTVGSRIQRSELIARIDDRGIRARLAQARAQIQVVAQDLRRAQAESARLQQLATRQLAARRDVENVELDVAAAQARLQKAQRDAAVIGTELEYTLIRAPIAGTIASVSTQEGETVAASFTAPTFVTIIADHALQLIALVDETDIGGVQVGNAANFTVEAFPAEEFSGTVERIAPKGTLISGVVNFEVTIGIGGRIELLRPDMTANVTVQTAARDALLVPDAAVQRSGGERYITVLSGGAGQRRDVTLGARNGGFTEVRRGLEVGEQVLVPSMPPNNLEKP